MPEITLRESQPVVSHVKSAGRSALLSVAFRLLPVTLMAATIGCSGGDGRVPVYSAEGKISVAGEVPDGALIVLYPAAAKAGAEQELRPSAKVKPDGTFSLTTYDANDGAPAGDYVATIQWNKLIKKGSDFVAGPDIVPKEYTSRETSPWKLTIASSRNQLEAVTIKK